MEGPVTILQSPSRRKISVCLFVFRHIESIMIWLKRVTESKWQHGRQRVGLRWGVCELEELYCCISCTSDLTQKHQTKNWHSRKPHREAHSHILPTHTNTHTHTHKHTRTHTNTHMKPSYVFKTAFASQSPRKPLSSTLKYVQGLALSPSILLSPFFLSLSFPSSSLHSMKD